MTPLRQQVEALFAQAVAADVEGLSGSCADILEHRAALWLSAAFMRRLR
jgi:transposase